MPRRGRHILKGKTAWQKWQISAWLVVNGNISARHFPMRIRKIISLVPILHLIEKDVPILQNLERLPVIWTGFFGFYSQAHGHRCSSVFQRNHAHPAAWELLLTFSDGAFACQPRGLDSLGRWSVPSESVFEFTERPPVPSVVWIDLAHQLLLLSSEASPSVPGSTPPP